MTDLRALALAAKRDFADFDIPWPTPVDVVDLNPTTDVAAYIAACSPDRVLSLLDVVDRARAMLDANTAFIEASTRAILRQAPMPPEITVRAALADAALRAALAALDGKGPTP